MTHQFIKPGWNNFLFRLKLDCCRGERVFFKNQKILLGMPKATKASPAKDNEKGIKLQPNRWSNPGTTSIDINQTDVIDWIIFSDINFSAAGPAATRFSKSFWSFFIRSKVMAKAAPKKTARKTQACQKLNVPAGRKRSTAITTKRKTSPPNDFRIKFFICWASWSRTLQSHKIWGCSVITHTYHLSGDDSLGWIKPLI